jgi:RNA polymerase sigma factor (sigma-70 family)
MIKGKKLQMERFAYITPAWILKMQEAARVKEFIQKKLFDENQRLISVILKSYSSSKTVSYEDMKHVAQIGLWKACTLYDPSRGTKFSTFAGIYIREALRIELFPKEAKKRTKRTSALLISDALQEKPSDTNTIFDESKLSAYILEKGTPYLDDKSKQILELRRANLTFREIAKRMGCDVAAIHRRHRKIMYTLLHPSVLGALYKDMIDKTHQNGEL